MRRVLSRAQMAEFDRGASSACGVPSLVLMENAGRGATDVIAREFALGARRRAIAVVCGVGNNAGDGYVVARRLALLGADVEVLALAGEDRLRGDALVNRRAFAGVGGRVHAIDAARPELLDERLERAEIAVDAIFGTGLSREPEGLFREAIRRLNAASARRVALDLPSGLDADTGRVLGEAVRAELTITFAAHKCGLLTPLGRAYAGSVVVADIGVPLDAVPDIDTRAWLLEPEDVARSVPRRAPNAHKVSSGRVLVLAGSPGKVGAALLVAQGALRAGAGLVTLAGTPELADTLDRRVLEAMTARLDPDALEASLAPLLAAADVVAIGPGLGRDERARRIVDHVVGTFRGTAVLDADAISRFEGAAAELARAPGRLVLTPHPGEMGRLLGTSSSEVEADRFGAVTRAAELTGAAVLLKGPHTLVARQHQPPTLLVLPPGSPALATGGAGDVLTGVIAALACQLDPLAAASAGAFLHARAAELGSGEPAQDRGLLAHEIADRVPRALAELSALPVLLPV